MTIDSATAGAVAALPSLPVTRPLPVQIDDRPDAPRWQVYAAVAAGLLGGALMVAGIVFPW